MSGEALQLQDFDPAQWTEPEAVAEPAAASETLGERLIRFLETAITGATGHESPPLDRMQTHEALAAWFGPSLTGIARNRPSIVAALERDIAGIDELLSTQISAILHATPFQKLEAGWRGLFFLAEISSEMDGAKIRVLPLTWNELARDVDRAGDIEQSLLFYKIYSEEFGMPGGEPFGLLVGDYTIQHQRSAGHTIDDISALKALASIAAVSFTPVILGASPQLLQLESFRQLGRASDLRAIFNQDGYRRWNAMREIDDLRFVGLTMPRILMRRPYVDDPARRDNFRFHEDTSAPDGNGFLWGNCAFAFAATVLRAFGHSGWFADIRGAKRDEMRGGLVYGLPAPAQDPDREGVTVRFPVEAIVADAQERDLTSLGFIPLRTIPLTDLCVFNESPSLQIPAKFDRTVANVNARIATMLSYVLCVSRFAHFIKVLGRERIGSLTTAEECEDYLQRWLMGYCEGSDDTDSEKRARYPLREGLVQVKNVPGKPGAYSCTVHLRPQYQFDQVSASFRLVTELAPTI